MTDRTPLPEQLDVIERMLARAKAEKDWHAIPALKATAGLIRWTMANADTLKPWPPSRWEFVRHLAAHAPREGRVVSAGGGTAGIAGRCRKPQRPSRGIDKGER
jgi:hypothetical protein